MKRFFAKVWRYGKAVALPVGSGALAAAGAGYFGQEGVAVAAALGSLVSLFVKRPQDPHPTADGK